MIKVLPSIASASSVKENLRDVVAVNFKAIVFMRSIDPIGFRCYLVDAYFERHAVRLGSVRKLRQPVPIRSRLQWFISGQQA